MPLTLIASKQQKNTYTWDYKSSTVRARIGSGILKYLFGLAIFLAMIISFFSLMASMYNNIMDQKKEIAVLKVLGMKGIWLVRVYIYEAFVLVLSSSLLGAGVGSLIAWTMSLQLSLAAQVPPTFRFPWELLLVIAALSFICALVATWKPIRSLLKQQTINLLRG